MSIEYVNTFQEARAVQGPKLIIWDSPGRILVLTGADIPTTPPEEITLTAWQLREALRQQPGDKLGAANTAVATMSARRQLFWEQSNSFPRSGGFINALKNKIAGMNNADFDTMFLGAQFMKPEDA